MKGGVEGQVRVLVQAAVMLRTRFYHKLFLKLDVYIA